MFVVVASSRVLFQFAPAEAAEASLAGMNREEHLAKLGHNQRALSVEVTTLQTRLGQVSFRKNLNLVVTGRTHQQKHAQRQQDEILKREEVLLVGNIREKLSLLNECERKLLELSHEEQRRTSLYLESLHESVTREHLQREFERFGSVESVNVIRRRTKIGFVNMLRSTDAERARTELHGRHLCGAKMVIKWACRGASLFREEYPGTLRQA